MTCVKSGRFTVNFNGVLSDLFQPSRGLGQGDPLSPYLFLLVADGLSLLLKKQEEIGSFTPLKVSRRAPAVSHLLFADDSLLFFHADAAQARKKETLGIFERCTGQLIIPLK